MPTDVDIISFNFDNALKGFQNYCNKYIKLRLWLTKELKLYKKIISSIDLQKVYNSRQLYILNNLEKWYSQTFGISIGDTYAKIVPQWNINKAKNIIKNDKIEISKLNVLDYAPYSQKGIINVHYAMNNNNTEPLIVVDCPFVEPKQILIDGNHRYYKALKTGKTSIDIYKLSEEQSLRAMSCDESRLIYKIYSNILLIDNYLLGNIKFLKYEKDNLFNMHESKLSKNYSQFLLNLKI